MAKIQLSLLNEQNSRLFAIVQSQAFLTALQQVDQDAEARKSAKANIDAYLSKSGVSKDPSVRATFQLKPEGWSICLNLGIISICYNR